MAESLCGPSNGAKNLLSHADRDRSLQQDRLVGGANGGPAVSNPRHPELVGGTRLIPAWTDLPIANKPQWRRRSLCRLPA
jgi:hypothetical protein